MRHSKESCSRGGINSQKVQENKRLSGALDYRPMHSYIVFEITTHNPRSGVRHHIVIKNEYNNGSNRYNVYLDGDKWREHWSRWGFCRWLFRQIDPVFVG